MDREIPKDEKNKLRNKKIIRFSVIGILCVAGVITLISLTRTGVKRKDLFVHSSSHELTKRIVQLGESNFEYVEVRSGLQPGDKVVVSDMSPYKNKNRLKVK